MFNYIYRNAPKPLDPKKYWCVTGMDITSGATGILEWCVNETDARNRLALMEASGEFYDLMIAKAKVTYPNPPQLAEQRYDIVVEL